MWPRFQLLEPGNAVVSLTFSHAGQRVRECRKLTQEELNELPPNMRKPMDCPRERRPVYVEFIVDGQIAYQASLEPSGVWKDGESTVYQRIRLEAGTHSLFIGMRDSDRAEGYDYQRSERLEFNDGQHVVVEFDHINQTFVFK